MLHEDVIKLEPGLEVPGTVYTKNGESFVGAVVYAKHPGSGQEIVVGRIAPALPGQESSENCVRAIRVGRSDEYLVR